MNSCWKMKIQVCIFLKCSSFCCVSDPDPAVVGFPLTSSRIKRRDVEMRQRLIVTGCYGEAFSLCGYNASEMHYYSYSMSVYDRKKLVKRGKVRKDGASVSLWQCRCIIFPPHLFAFFILHVHFKCMLFCTVQRSICHLFSVKG